MSGSPIAALRPPVSKKSLRRRFTPSFQRVLGSVSLPTPLQKLPAMDSFTTILSISSSSESTAQPQFPSNEDSSSSTQTYCVIARTEDAEGPLSFDGSTSTQTYCVIA
ncbi:hypothetical protein PUNSTDRAFT_132186 [Punctularia strigosozonata HHB-11173 SS5]|uniref:uncharacterized protein n=1 Tax=Punctularia strigosozonata (strain HHB-11173) TaxID=741275 RepID=UPI00044162D2|nr:uncharacterized protein PUNSTDRAFT_132186 [Punctularia strigosozonata HHB-11173 SS5]EIN12056.1 hypothetical protein PUNSTDRAFT_132186 [Punctularia strigosozonata HHB-11173 SS5]